MMATHPLTMILRIKLLLLIHIDRLRKLISVQVFQTSYSISGQISNDIWLAPSRSKLASKVADQSPEGSQDLITFLKFPRLDSLSECTSHLPLIGLNMIYCP